MRTRTAFLVVAALFVAFAFNTPAPAATAYTNLASFLGALTNSYTENFSGITNTSSTFTAAPQNFSGNGMSFSANPTSSGLWTIVNGETKWLSVVNSGSSLAYTLTSGNITAVGGNFFVTDAEQNFIEGAIINILFSDSTSTNWAPPSVSDFIGFVFDAPVASMTLSPVASPTFVTAGTITVGQVPEPSIHALLLMTGVGALWWARRRR